MSTEDILAAAKSLPESERLKLIDQLLDSVYAEDSAIDEEWAQLIVRRGREIDRGDVELIPAEQVLEEAQRRLDSKCG